MAESVDRIEVQETNEGESADGCDNENIHEGKSDKQNVVSEFLTETSLHGLKYVGQSKRHFVERTFWIVAFIIGIAAAGYLIYGVFSRYEGTPVIVSFQSEEQSVDTIPFPAVTFCFSTLFSKSYVESLKRYRDGLHQGGPEYMGITEMLSKIDSICLSRKSLLDVYVDSYVATINSRWDYYYIRNQTQYQQEIIDLLLQYTFSCKDLIPYVLLDGTPIEAVHIFDPVITKEYGKCCTFNMLPSPLMLKQPSVDDGNEGDIFSNPVLGTNSKRWWNPAVIDDWRKWSFDKGFILSPDSYESRIVLNHPKVSRPYRNQRLGYRFGLSVAINSCKKKVEPYCDKVAFRGTTFMLHNPVDTPRVSQFPSVIGVNQEAFIKIHPDITIADDDIRDLTVKKRRCFFGKEKVLKYFNPYTQENCFEECIANLIEKNCKCSMFYMPRPNETILCGLYGQTTEGTCVITTLSLLSKKEICGHCLPLCEYIAYNFEMTAAKISNLNYTPAGMSETQVWHRELHFYNRSSSDTTRNISFAHIFYGSPSTVPKLRKRLYGITDLIANTGGVLGLCLGFSVLSGAEVLYYGLMRTIWRMFSRGNNSCDTKASASGAIGTTKLRNQANSNKSGSDKMSKLTKVFSKFCCNGKCLSLRFKWIYCIVIASVGIGFLVYMLLIRNDEYLNKKDTLKIPTDLHTRLEWAEATFCYKNQFSLEKVLEFRRLATSTTDENLRHSAEMNLSIIDAMCNYKDALETSSATKFPPITPDVSNYTFYMEFLKENTISCSQMVPSCAYLGIVRENCHNIVTTIYTVHGKCCTISMKPIKLNNANSSVSSRDKFPTYNPQQFNAEMDLIPNANKIDNSSILSGAEFNSSYIEIYGSGFPENKQVPYFSLLLDLNEDRYQCHNSTTSSNQILFTLHSPGKLPTAQDFSSLQVANEEIAITVFPETYNSDGPDKVMNNGDKNCTPHYWPSKSRFGTVSFGTTEAAYFDGCSSWFVLSNCNCALYGDYPLFKLSFCKTGNNSNNDVICLRKMRKLVNETKSLCGTSIPRCKGTDYLYKTKNQTMKNAKKLWESLRNSGSDTSGEIPWANNKTGIIHFTFNTSRQTPTSINNGKQLQNLIADWGEFSTVTILTVAASLICVPLILLPLLWRCIRGLIVKRTLNFHGALHTMKT